MRLFRLVPMAILVALVACSTKPASIDVAQKKVKIYGLERGQRLTVRVLDKKGRPLEKAIPTFSSSKADVASVDGGGRIVAKSEGKAVVTVSFEKLSAQVPVEIVDIKMIEVLPPSVQLIGPVGTQFPLQATPKNSKDKPVEAKAEWTSPKPAIATVSPEGVVKSVGPGVVTLLAKIGDVESACEVRVTLRDVARLEIRPATAIVRAGLRIETVFRYANLFPLSIDLSVQRRERLARFVTDRFPLEKAADAFATAHARGANTIKVMVEMA